MTDIDVNVRAPYYFVARTRGRCSACAASSPLAGVALPALHSVSQPPDDDEDDGAAVWSTASGPAFVFFLEWLPEGVQRRLRHVAPAFGPQRGTAGDSQWLNHCESCGTPFDDQALYCEPEGPFLPVDDAAAALVQLLRIDEPFEAASGGYAGEPPCFAAMSRG